MTTIRTTTTYRNGKRHDERTLISSPPEEIEIICSMNDTFNNCSKNDTITIFWVNQPCSSFEYKQEHGFYKIIGVMTDDEFKNMIVQ